MNIMFSAHIFTERLRDIEIGVEVERNNFWTCLAVFPLSWKLLCVRDPEMFNLRVGPFQIFRHERVTFL